MNTWLIRGFLCALLLAVTPVAVLADEVDTDDAPPRRAEALAFNCFTCHGPDGHSPGAIKSLHELSAAEIRDKLRAFRRDRNNPTIMNRIAKGYSDAEIALIANYIAGLK